MKNTVNIAIQILPSSTKKYSYNIVDKAIEVIQSNRSKNDSNKA